MSIECFRRKEPKVSSEISSLRPIDSYYDGINHQQVPQAKSLSEDFVGYFLGEMSVACVHSLTGLVMVGGLAYLAIQSEKGQWVEQNEQGDRGDGFHFLEEMNVTEGMEALDVLVGETRDLRRQKIQTGT